MSSFELNKLTNHSAFYTTCDEQRFLEMRLVCYHSFQSQSSVKEKQVKKDTLFSILLWFRNRRLNWGSLSFAGSLFWMPPMACSRTQLGLRQQRRVERQWSGGTIKVLRLSLSSFFLPIRRHTRHTARVNGPCSFYTPCRRDELMAYSFFS